MASAARRGDIVYTSALADIEQAPQQLPERPAAAV
jgi:hypothetical protein